MRSDTIKRCLWPIAVAGQLVGPSMAMAATGDADTAASNNGLEEIVVTATRTPEPADQIPADVSVVSGTELRQRNAWDMQTASRIGRWTRP